MAHFLPPGLALLVAPLLVPCMAQYRVKPCEGAQNGSAWCDSKLGFDERVSALVKALTTAEKSTLLSNTAHAVPRLDLPAYVSSGPPPPQHHHAAGLPALTPDGGQTGLVERGGARLRARAVHQRL